MCESARDNCFLIAKSTHRLITDGKIRTKKIKACLDHFNTIEKENCESEGIPDLGRLTVGVEYDEGRIQEAVVDE